VNRYQFLAENGEDGSGGRRTLAGVGGAIRNRTGGSRQSCLFKNSVNRL
jgi:hypothetical protein